MSRNFETGRFFASLGGILLGGVLVYNEFFKLGPPEQTGNQFYDEGAQVGHWTFVATGIAIALYSAWNMFSVLFAGDK